MQQSRRKRRDFHGMESRRLQAAKWFASGMKQAEVARRLGVSRQSVSRWYHLWKQGGVKALKAAPRAGRPAKLTPAQLKKVDRALRKGPRAHGFATDLWTRVRLAKVIRRLTGVRYHPGHVSKLMHRLGWSVQRPAKRARERNEVAIQTWRDERWPAIKKKRVARRPGSSSKTKAASRSGPRSGAPGRRAVRRRS